MSEAEAALNAALVAAQEDAQALVKAERGPKAAFVSTETMIREARRVLHGHGLGLLTTHTRVDTDRMMLECRYRLIHKDGAAVEIESETPVVLLETRDGKAIRGLDKDAAAAKTFDLGYTIRGLLMIPRVNEDHPDARAEPGQHPAHRRGRALTPRPVERWRALLAREKAFVADLFSDRQDEVRDAVRLANSGNESALADFLEMAEYALRERGR